VYVNIVHPFPQYTCVYCVFVCACVRVYWRRSSGAAALEVLQPLQKLVYCHMYVTSSEAGQRIYQLSSSHVRNLIVCVCVCVCVCVDTHNTRV